jgi:predicted ATPase/DNA-binding winged helix-turn-helix (wHTH) protein
VTLAEEALSADRAISFGPFRLLPRQRLLLEADKPVHVGSRAVDLLIALVERPGELLSKNELIARVWPSTHVVEGNLKFQIAALRRALRDGQEGRRYLATSPGQGYRFVADITIECDAAPSIAPSSPPTNKHNLPARLTPLIGRGDLVARLESRLPAKRLITIVGPGGIGKTSVAMATAERLIGAYIDGVWSVDLARLADPALVLSAVAAAVHINLNPEGPLASLVAALSNSSMMLVLDNCEHVIDAVASLVVAITKGARGVHILATSREPLRVEGEHVSRLEPLETPPSSERLEAAEALRFPAVELFVDRMAASHEEFELRHEDASLVGEICRQLDGIPLAIELAAARVDLLGVRELSARLEEGLQVLKCGRRTVLPRHQTMRATLDWSYGLLSPPEQTILSRLAIFAGGFTLPAAAAVVGDADLGGEEVVDLVLELATKSLVASDGNFLEPRFRLLATTRAYAIEKARERGELDPLAQRHATYFLTLFDSVSHVDAEFDEASAALALEINNLRTALGWAFAPPGDLAVGIGLVAASVPLRVSTSMLGEWHVWAERAIDSLDDAGLRGTRPEMTIRATQGMSFQLVRNRAADGFEALTRALELAETLRDADYQLRILHTLWIYHMRMGEVRTAIALAHRADPIAASLRNPVASATAESMLGIALHWAGEHESARRRLECLLQELTTVPRRHFVHRAGFDLYIVARYVLAHILWVQGYLDHAMNALGESIEEARRLQNPQSLCSALAFGGCSLALQMGDLDMAERLVAELVGTAQRHALEDFHAWGKAAQEVVSLRRGHGNPGPEQLRLAIRRWRASGWHILLSSSDLAVALVEAGDRDETSAIIDEELERAEREQALSMVAELLRIRGELLLLQDRPDPELARDCFMRSIERANAQGALSWELRTALSLALLERSQGRMSEARQLLQGVYDRFTEGFETSDLKRAKRLLDEWTSAPALTPQRREFGSDSPRVQC